jgi:hypothetical protein
MTTALLLMRLLRKRKVKKLLLLQILRERIRERNSITTDCLVNPKISVWQYFYETGNDENFIHILGINKASFQYLLNFFAQKFQRKWDGGKGRPPKLRNEAILGLLLTFYCDRMCQKSLCMEFGIPPSTLSRTLLQAEIALDEALDEIPETRFSWPTLEEQREWADKVNSKYPLVRGRWGFIDGKNLRIRKPPDSEIQNAHYNGWLHATYVTGVLCFGVDGCIVWGLHNCPGSWNDGEMCSEFVEKICRDDINLPGHGVIADSAFPSTGRCFQRIISPLKQNELENAHPAAREAMKRVNTQILACRQACEWGMGAIVKVFQRLLEELPYDGDRRAMRLLNIFRLFNLRVRRTGISQIRNNYLA